MPTLIRKRQMKSSLQKNVVQYAEFTHFVGHLHSKMPDNKKAF